MNSINFSALGPLLFLLQILPFSEKNCLDDPILNYMTQYFYIFHEKTFIHFFLQMRKLKFRNNFVNRFLYRTLE